MKTEEFDRNSMHFRFWNFVNEIRLNPKHPPETICQYPWALAWAFVRVTIWASIILMAVVYFSGIIVGTISQIFLMFNYGLGAMRAAPEWSEYAKLGSMGLVLLSIGAIALSYHGLSLLATALWKSPTKTTDQGSTPSLGSSWPRAKKEKICFRIVFVDKEEQGDVR